MADDYPAVMDDEDELQKRNQYPAPAPPPAMPTDATAPMPGAMPAPEMQAPVPGSQYPAPAPANLGPQPNRQQAINNTIGMAPDPSAKQYQPASPSIRQRIGAGLVAFKNPQLGNEMMEEAAQRPVQQYGRESAAYGQKLATLEKGEQQESTANLQQSEAEKNRAQGHAADVAATQVPVVINGMTYNVPQKDAEKLIGTGLTQGGGDQRNSNTVAGENKRNADTIAGENEREKGREATLKDIAGEKKSDEGTWSIQEDGNGNPIEFNDKTGATRPAPNIQKSGTHIKASDATKKLTEPVDTAVGYADDYLTNGAFTGPGDEALQEKFFELAKPATGFRMTQPQMDMLKNSRGWMGGAEAHLRHMATGTWFSNDQRQQIVNTMKELAESKKKAIAGEGKGNNSTPERPKGVPDDAKWDANKRVWYK